MGFKLEEDSKYDQIVSDVLFDELTGSAKEGYYNSLMTNPDAQAEALRISRSTGLPVNAILSNPEEAKRWEAMVSVDFDVLALVAPATVRLMGNYEAAKLARDDLENMGYIEILANSVRRGALGLRSNFATLDAQMYASNIQRELEFERNLASGMNKSQAVTIYKGNRRPTYVWKDPDIEIAEIRRTRAKRMKVWEKGLAKSAATIADLQKRKNEIIVPSVVGKVTQANGFMEALSEFSDDPLRFTLSIGAEATVQSVPGIVAAVPATFAAGPWGGAAAIGGWSALNDYTSTIQDVLIDAKVDISDKTAIQTALKDPEILERVISEAWRHAAVVGSVDLLSGGLASKTMVTGAVARKLAGKPFATELANIGVQTVTQGILGGFGEFGGELFAGQKIKPGQIIAEFFGQAFGAPAEVLSVTSNHLYKNISKVHEAEQSSQVVDGINQAASASKLLSRDPQTFEAFIADVVKDGPVENIYIDVNALVDSGVAQEVAEVSPSVAQQLEVARQTGGLIAIPMQEYVTYVAPKEFSSVLVDHLKVDPDGLSRAEARSYRETQGESLRQQIENALAENGNDKAFKASIEQVRTWIQDELNVADRFSGDVHDAYSSMVGHYYGVQAAKMGVTPEQLFQQYPLKVRSNLDGIESYKMVDPNWMPPGMEKGDSARIGEMYDDKDSVRALLLSQVDQSFAGKAKEAGLNIDHFSHSVDQSALKHIKNHHGNVAKEKARGQIAITSQDVTRIPDIVANYDAVRFDLHRPNGQPVIAYVKKYSDGVIFYAEVMRNKRMDLSAISMRKYPATSDAIKILNNANSYVQAGGGHESIIGDFIGIDNTNIRGAFTPESLTISLLAKADLSTFLHESGHLFLDLQERLAAQIQERINAGGEVSAGEKAIVGDMQVVLDWLGVKDIDQWNHLDLEQKRPYHEQFARGFESYLFEGKSPSIEMQGIFQRFRSWLLHVYKSLKSLNVSLTDDVRGVFDRMIATNEQIENASYERQMFELFDNAEQAGMSPAEFREYQRLGIDATLEAIDKLQSKSLRDLQWAGRAKGRQLDKLKRASKSLRRRVEKQVQDEVMDEPIYQAWSFLKSKDGLKLSRSALVDLYSQEGRPHGLFNWKRLQVERMVAKEGGVHPDVVAQQFGFSSGDELVRKLVGAVNPGNMVQLVTDARMLERYGEVATSQALERASDEAVHNEYRARMVKREYDSLAKTTGQKAIGVYAAKRFTKELIEGLRVRDLKPNRFSNAQARAAREAKRTLGAGDVVQASVYKRNELFQNYAVIAAYKAQERVEKGLVSLAKFYRDEVKGLDAEYRDQIDGILVRFGLGRHGLMGSGEGRSSLAAWLESQKKKGYEPDIADFLLNDADRRSYKDLTVEEFSRLVDGIKQIENLGRSVGKFFSDRMGKSVQEVSQELESAVLSQWREGKSGDQQAGMKAHGLEWGKQKLMSFFAAHLKPTMIMRVFDGGRDDGVFQRYLGDDAMRADSAEMEMNVRASIAFGAMIDELKTEQFEGKGRFFESVGRSFNRSEVIGIALNMGNEGNRQRVLSFEGWQWEQVVPVLQSLSSGDWAVIEKIWNYVGSYVPRFRALQRRFYGVEPRWLEVSGFDIVASDGKTVHVKGGFYPVVYEAKVNGAAKELFDAQEAKREVLGDFGSALVAMSFTKAQAQEHLDVPLRYDLSGVYEGVSDVIHYLAWGEFLFDADKLMRHRNVDEAIRTVYGAEFKKQMDVWLKNIANGRHISTRHGGEWVARLRQNVSAAAIGFNLVNALAQPLGITQSISRIGARWVAEGFREFMANPVGANRLANEKSVMMRTRSLTRFREVNELKNRVVDKGQVWASVRCASYVPALVMQKWIATITWHGAYKRGIFEGLDEEVAVVRADQVVTDALGSETSRGLSAIEQAGGQWGRLFTVFYSSFNTPLNLAYVSAKTRSPAQRAADWLLLITVPVVGNMFLRELVSFGDDEDKDQGKNKDKNFSWWAKKLGSAHLSYLMNMFVGVREFSLGAEKLCGMDDVPEFYSGTSGMRVFNDVLKYSLKVEQGKFDVAMVEAAVSLLGDVTGLPAAQMNKVITGAKALAEGKTDNALVMGFGFKEGKPPEQ